jgi:LmbE family N-acetylglucosaminyl deacetylase
MDRWGTLLLVWAHPDDDIYTSAGMMAAAAAAGDRVVDVTATRGEGGSMDEERWPPATMGQVRTAELLRSLEILGVGEHRFLEGPVDVDMQAHLDESGAEQVKTIMAEVDPDTVVTFGPDGMTGHQGHKDVSRWTTDAFEAIAKPGARLLYATQTPEWTRNGSRSWSGSTSSSQAVPPRRRSRSSRSISCFPTTSASASSRRSPHTRARSRV